MFKKGKKKKSMEKEVAGAGNNFGLPCPLLVDDANVERTAPCLQNEICSPLGESFTL